MSQLWAFFWSLVWGFSWSLVVLRGAFFTVTCCFFWSWVPSSGVVWLLVSFGNIFCPWSSSEMNSSSLSVGLVKTKAAMSQSLVLSKNWPNPVLLAGLHLIYSIGCSHLVESVKTTSIQNESAQVIVFIYFPSLWFSSNGALISAFIFNEDSQTPSVVWRHALAFPGVYLCVCVLTNAEFSCNVAAHSSHQYCPKWKKFKKLFWSYGMT